MADDAELVARHRELADGCEPVYAQLYGELSDRGGDGQSGQSPDSPG
ncbi:hypothetical protein [Salinigranum salinum]|nr:hypothetical protein [Salinigranum salinum]